MPKQINEVQRSSLRKGLHRSLTRLLSKTPTDRAFPPALDQTAAISIEHRGSSWLSFAAIAGKTCALKHEGHTPRGTGARGLCDRTQTKEDGLPTTASSGPLSNERHEGVASFTCPN